LNVNSSKLFQLFKYTVYALLAMNIYWFFVEERAAALVQFSGGVGIDNVREAYSSTIDTLAWVVLLLMFELETYVLEDEHITKPIALSLHGLRILCYVTITTMVFGYIDNLIFVNDVLPLAGITDVCALQPAEWSWAIDLDEYTPIAADNCASFSTASTFVQFRDVPAIVDAAGHTEIVRLAWVDVINSIAWLLVVIVLEIDVRLQEHNRYEGLALKASTAAKFVLYSTLLLAAIYWGVKGDFVDFWDAFLWLVAFVFIELNVFEWREEENAALAADAAK